MQVGQGSGAEVDDERQTLLVGQFGQLALRYGMGEALNRIVTGVDLHQHGRARCDRFAEVLQVRAVGGADFDQLGTGLPHNVGDAEGAADLDQLTPRDDDLFLARQGVEQQKDGRGIVVDDGGGLGARELAEQVIDDVVAITTSAVCEIVFKGTGVAGGHHQGLDGRFRQGSSAEIGVQYSAGEIEDRAKLGLGVRLRAADDLLDKVRCVGDRGTGPCCIPGIGQGCADDLCHDRLSVAIHQGRHLRIRKQATHGGQLGKFIHLMF